MCKTNPSATTNSIPSHRKAAERGGCHTGLGEGRDRLRQESGDSKRATIEAVHRSEKRWGNYTGNNGHHP
ncbi:MAG: hypothetical protein IIX12_03825 [Alistipes sp.]|nr:hypothetical protein [Alistipes sp.]MBQ5638766.1 hypothetical protein [Alistipes sp.]MBR0330711.1 hypothetical protein [Alistipes sp.]